MMNDDASFRATRIRPLSLLSVGKKKVSPLARFHKVNFMYWFIKKQKQQTTKKEKKRARTKRNC